MTKHWASAVLLALLCALQAQIWMGRGSVSDVAELREQLATQHQANQDQALANEVLASEIDNLRKAKDMVEAYARHDLGFIKPNEIFVQYPHTAK